MRIGGSERDEHVELAAGGVTYTLAGSLARELRGWPGSVCVTYDRGDGRYLGGPNAINVDSYRLRGDGTRAPILGRIAQNGTRFVMRTDDGKTFTVRAAASQLAPIAGRHIWLDATWHDGALEPLRLGLLGPQ